MNLEPPCGYLNFFVTAQLQAKAMIHSAHETIKKMSAAGELPEVRNPEIEELAKVRPNPKSLLKILATDPMTLGPSDRVDFLTAFERHVSWINFEFQEAIVAVAGESSTEPEKIFDGVDQSERDEVATALRISSNTAQTRIDVARTLVKELPATCEALAAGDISIKHADSIAREIESAIRLGVPKEAIEEIEKVGISYSEFHTPRQVELKVRSAFAKLAPDLFAVKVEKAMETRSVRCYPDSDGMSQVLAILPAAGAQTVMNAIETFVEIEKANEELGIIKEIVDRSMENRRADALIEIAELAISMKGNLVKHHRRPASINIVMDLATALGLANNPGFLTGYGPIPADVARHFANDGKWKKFITDPGTGNLLDMGRETYVPPQQLQDFLIARDRTCRFPGCRKSALRSEIDHAIPWEKGGKTNPENMGVLCKRHHRLKTHGDWKLKSFPDGSCEWTSPNGRVIPVPARPMLDAV